LTSEQGQTLEVNLPITLTPASPGPNDEPSETDESSLAESEASNNTEKDSTHSGGPGKKVQRMVKKSVKTSQARITAVSRKIGRSGSVHLRRTSSVPGTYNLLELYARGRNIHVMAPSLARY
jgi:hypothetical protein